MKVNCFFIFRKFFFVVAGIGIFWTLFTLSATAAEKAPVLSLPSKPDNYINDYAKILSVQTMHNLNSQLKNYQVQTSNQIVVAIFPGKLPLAIEDFSTALENQWKIGQKKKDNGILIVIFPQERQLRIEVGYGLEGALPDTLTHQIITQEMLPAFQQGNYDAGITKGIQAVMQSIKGEYRPDKYNNQNFYYVLLAVFAGIVMWAARKTGRFGNNINNRPGGFGGGIGFPPSDNSGFGGGGGGSSGGGGASGRW